MCYEYEYRMWMCTHHDINVEVRGQPVKVRAQPMKILLLLPPSHGSWSPIQFVRPM